MERIVVLCTDTPVAVVELCSSSRVTLGLCAVFLINAVLARRRSMSFGVQPSLGRFAVVPCFFHLVIIDLMVLLGIMKDSDIFV